MTVSAPTASAQPDQEQKVTAAILYNLARFSDWPVDRFENKGDQFVICALADPDMTRALTMLESKDIKGRAIKIHAISENDEITRKCHVVFQADSDASQLDYKALAKLNILSVGNSKAYLENGGGMAIHRRSNTLGFSISKTNMQMAGITPSSKILKLAAKVQ